MSEEKRMDEDKVLSEDELDAVAGGSGGASVSLGVCSACGRAVEIAGVQLPFYCRCPSCGQEAFISPWNYPTFS